METNMDANALIFSALLLIFFLFLGLVRYYMKQRREQAESKAQDEEHSPDD